MTNIEIPGSLKSIEDFAFCSCPNLLEIYVPDSVIEVGYNIIDEYPTLIYCNEGSYISTHGEYKKYCITFTESFVEQAGNYLFSAFDPKTRTLTFSGKGVEYSDYVSPYRRYVENINFVDYSSAILPRLQYPNLINIDFPEGITKIDNYAFKNCERLERIEIPSGITSIGDCAFYNCSNLISIVLPDGLTSIGDYAYEDCSSLVSIEFPESLTSIGDGIFYNCSSLTSIVLPDELTHIGYNAFKGCSSMTSIVFPDELEYIGYSAFESCSSLASIEFPESLISIEQNAFKGCSSLTSIVLPEGLTYIEDATFSGCRSLTDISIPDSVMYIGSYAFSSCDNLTNVTIPQEVSYLHNYAFAYCSSLKEVYIIDPDLEFEPYVFDHSENIVLYCPPDSAVARYAEQNGIPFNTTTIPSSTVITEATNSIAGTIVKWKPVSGVSGYYLYRDEVKIATIHGDLTESYLDTEGNSNSTYSIETYNEIDGQIYQSASSETVHSVPVKEEVKPETKPEIEPETKPETKPEATKTTPQIPIEKITITKKPTIKTPSSTNNKITIKWSHFKHTSKKAKKIWKPIKKIQVQCATDKAFKNIVKTTTVGKSKKKATIKGLKKNTTYYVRVRYTDKTGYSKWSKVKKIKTKKK